MQLIFLASPTEEKNRRATYDSLIELSKKVGHKVFDGTHYDDPKELQRLTIQINSSDAVLVEASETDFDLARFISLALNQRKLVLILFQNKPPSMTSFSTNRLVYTKKYDLKNLDELTEYLKEFVKSVKNKRLLYRFNLMLNRELNMFLMDRARENGVSKADYIRTLIDKDMTSDM